MVVTKLDRLARSLPDARDILDELTRRNVKLSLGGSIHDPTDPVGQLLFNVSAMVAEFESDLIKMRAREGMKVAKAKGRLRGKQPKLKPNQAKHLFELHDLGTYTQAELAELFGVGRSTVYRTIERMRPRRREPERRFAQMAGPAVDQHRSQHSAESQPTDLVRPSSDAPRTPIKPRGPDFGRDLLVRYRLLNRRQTQAPPHWTCGWQIATPAVRQAERSVERSAPCCSAHPNPKRPDAGEAGDQRGLEVRAELVAHKVKPRVHRGGDDDQIRPDRDQVSRAGEHVGDADQAAAAIKRKAGTIRRSSAIEPKIVTVQQSR